MRHSNGKRSRGRSGRRGGGNSGGGTQNANRAYDSNGPAGKLRGTAAQLVEKYTSLARDARVGRDRVLVENYFQHAEHYQRLINEIAAQQAQQQQEQAKNQPQNQSQPQANGHDQKNDQGEKADVEQTPPQPVAQSGNGAQPETVSDNGASPVIGGTGDQPNIDVPVPEIAVDVEEKPAPRRRRKAAKPAEDQAEAPDSPTPAAKKPAQPDSAEAPS